MQLQNSETVDRLSLLLEYLKEDPGDAFTRFALAMEYVKTGNEVRALETFEALVGDQPDYVGTYYHLAALYLRKGLTDEALETYRAGIRIADRQRDTHARAELQSALLEAEGFGFDDE